MQLKWNRYINRPERTTPLKNSTIPDFYMEFSSLLQVDGRFQFNTELGQIARHRYRAEIKDGVLAQPRAY